MNKKFTVLMLLLLFFTALLAACQPDDLSPIEETIEIPGTGPTATPPPHATGLPIATPTASVDPEVTIVPQPTADAEIEPDEPQILWTKELKQAIAAAIDREALVDRVFEGRRTPAYHVIPPGSSFFSEPFFERYGPRDLNLAEQLLNQLGYTKNVPFELDLWYPEPFEAHSIHEVLAVIKEQLEETGLIRVHLQAETWEAYQEYIQTAEMPFFIAGHSATFADAEIWLSYFASCDLSSFNGIYYCDPEMDALLQQGAVTRQSEARQDVYAQAGQLFAERVPSIPLFWEAEFLAFQEGVVGAEINPQFGLDFTSLQFNENALPASGSRETIIIGSTTEILNLDPQQARLPQEIELLKNIGMPLLRYSTNGVDLYPEAAVDLPQIAEDGLSYIFTLRENLEAEDGRPLRALDYVNAWENLVTSEIASPLTRYIESVEAIDERTIVYNLFASYVFMPALSATTALMPDSSAGPYRITDHQPGEMLVLETNPNYSGGQTPNIPNVIIRYFEDSTALADALEQRGIDLAWRSLGLAEALQLQNLDEMQVIRADDPTLYALMFNHRYMVTAK